MLGLYVWCKRVKAKSKAGAESEKQANWQRITKILDLENYLLSSYIVIIIFTILILSLSSDFWRDFCTHRDWKNSLSHLERLLVNLYKVAQVVTFFYMQFHSYTTSRTFRTSFWWCSLFLCLSLCFCVFHFVFLFGFERSRGRLKKSRKKFDRKSWPTNTGPTQKKPFR